MGVRGLGKVIPVEFPERQWLSLGWTGTTVTLNCRELTSRLRRTVEEV